MTEKYTLNDIFAFEDITRVYCISKVKQLTPKELITMAAMEEEFNVEYALYLHFKHKHQITEFIKRRDRSLASSLRFISDDIMDEEDEFEQKIKAIPFKVSPTVFDILEVAIRNKQWDLVFYVYQTETSGLYNLITQTEDEKNNQKDDIKNKKFFIFQ